MAELKTKTTIEWIKIASSIFLGVMLLVTVITIITYQQETKEILKSKEPDRLMQKYEEVTNLKCLCCDPEYGMVIYVPLSSR